MLKIKIAPKLWIKQENPNQYTVGNYQKKKGQERYMSDMHYFPNLELAARYCRDKLALDGAEISTVEQMAKVYRETTDKIIEVVKEVRDEAD